MATAARDVTDVLAATPYLSDVANGSVRELADKGRVRDYRKGTYLCHQGDPPDDVFCLINGRVEISSSASSGARILHATVDTPQFFGELATLGEIERTASILALEDSRVWAVPSEIFLDFLTREPAASRAMLRALARQVHANEAFVDDLLFLDLKGRVAKRLLQFVTPSLDDLPKDGAVVPSTLTHADLASMCGGSRENVTRVLSEFQRRKLVSKSGRRYVLRNVDGLAKLAGL
jgi:CRP/FNR family transcriptional regulator/CRP/FNR family cyclic AMP-dependent transcriptional regulator